MPCLYNGDCYGSGRSVARLSLRSFGFDPRSVHVRFAVDRVAGFPATIDILPYDYHSTATYTYFNYLQPTLYNPRN